MTRRIVALLALIGLLLAPGFLVSPAPVRAQTSCTFILGFDYLHSLIPTIVGNCLENEWHNALNGDGIQQTTGGMMVWRKASNTMAFTDGYRTWVYSICGLQQRLNSQRFAWEPEIGGGVSCTAAPAPLPAGYVPPPPPSLGPTPTPTPSSQLPVISYFNAAPGTINSGDSSTLSWGLSGAVTAEIDNGIGGVPAPGSMAVTPTATTTYTLTAHGVAGDVSARVTVNVNQPARSTLYDFIAMANSPGVVWQSGAGLLLFGSTADQARGFVRWVENATLNDGSTAARVLETHPQWVTNGFISGCYPLAGAGYVIQANDRVSGRIGFLNGAAAGDVVFQVAIKPELAGTLNIVSIHRAYGEGPISFDVAMGSAWAGRRADICLNVDAGASSDDDWAVWRDVVLTR